ncbi:MAG TPA: carboxylase [Candidatus Aminicenantes bacterium]|nr:carboxylase [Candidatus Aminicenantes bacterium]
MGKTLKIRDLTLRDGQQSAFATRMTQAQVDRVLPYYRQAGFYAMEVWGGAVPDSVMRYLGENPWHRLEIIRREVGDASRLTALSRGRNLFGYNPYPDSVIEGFCRNAVKSGIGIMRIFDALNDIDNMTASIRFVKENGGLADCAVCYTVDPHFTSGERFKALLRGKRLPRSIFTVDYFVQKARALQEHGADMITVKDMAGLITPQAAAALIPALKRNLDVPVNLHTHCTPGFGLASVLMAMVCGVDIVDTVILNFSGGPAAPGFELVQLFADRLGLDTGVDRAAVASINRELKTIRKELAPFDAYQEFLPIDFDLAKDRLPAEIATLFDQAVERAQAGRIDELLDVTHRIERHFGFPPPDDAVRLAQIPGGMYTNMMAQIKQAKLEHLFDRVLKLVPSVRLDAGCPPLVTPTSQIVGVQAVNCVVDETQGKPHYSNTSTNFVNLVKGTYGKTPFPVDPAFRKRIAGVEAETPYDTSKYQPQPNPVLKEAGGVRLALGEKEELLLELFPSVAADFLKKVRLAEFAAKPKERDADFDRWEELPLAMS